MRANLDRPEAGKPVQLPTPDLLTQAPMKQPDLKARAAAKLKAQQERERKAQEKAQKKAQKKSPTEADQKVAPAGNET
mgnify:CR=1 FL=1